MKKKYSKPEAKVYAVMPCMTLAANSFTGTTEGMGSNGDFNWGTSTTSTTSSDDSETNSETYKRTHPLAY